MQDSESQRAGRKNARYGARKREALNQAAWIAEARLALIAGGVGAVKIGRLATKLAVTRESFYWHFKNVSELLDHVLDEWEHGNSAVYKSLLKRGRSNGLQEFREMVQIWLDEGRYSPGWDAAIRDWARSSKKVARAVVRVDKLRIDVIQQMFRDMGYDESESLVRARITYFHQIGYYTIALGESTEQRARLAPIYLRILTGKPAAG